MKLSGEGDTLMSNTCFTSISVEDYNDTMENLTLFNLPNSKLETKLEFIKFSFLMSIIPETNVRLTIDKSRITEPFWSAIRNLGEFRGTFDFFSDKEMLNMYKYITFFDVMKDYNTEFVTKALFLLSENGEITEKTSLAQIGRTLNKYMKKINRKNTDSKEFNKVNNINLLFYYFKQCEGILTERLCSCKWLDLSIENTNYLTKDNKERKGSKGSKESKEK